MVCKIQNQLFDLAHQFEKYPQSNFGYVRKHDIHTGIDIYTLEHSEIYPFIEGKVVSIEQFTGEEVGCSWWNKTYCVVVETTLGLMLYGEIIPDASLKINQNATSETLLGKVTPVLKKDKGINPTNMLHFEIYSSAPVGVVWNLDESKPSNLLNPLESLFFLKQLGQSITKLGV